MKRYLLSEMARKKIIVGAGKTANLVKLTLGPKGRNVVLDRKFAPPLVTNDGVTIAREIELEDIFENVGCKMIKEACQKTNSLAGDGTTTSIVLAQKILDEGYKMTSNGYSPMIVTKGIKKAKDIVVENLKKIAKKVTTSSEIAQVATISSGDKEIGALLSKAHSLAQNGNILLQNSKSSKTELVFQEGLTINSGLVSPYLATEIDKGVCSYDECLLLVTDKKLNSFNSLVPVFELSMGEKKPLLIICDDIDDEVLSAIVVNKMRGTFACCVIKSALYGDKKLALLEDITSLCGGNVISSAKEMQFENITKSDLGCLKNAKITKDSTTIIPKQIDKDRLEIRKALIKSQIDECDIDFDKEQLKKRLSSLCGGVATIYVGADTELEQKEKKLRIEDAISSTSCALDGGIASGGGTALYKLSLGLKSDESMCEEERVGFEILKKALSSPICNILKNGGYSKDIILEKIKENSDFSFGFDAQSGKFCNMIESGIIDPVKVTISALESAVSVATTMLTTAAIVVEDDDKK